MGLIHVIVTLMLKKTTEAPKEKSTSSQDTPPSLPAGTAVNRASGASSSTSSTSSSTSPSTSSNTSSSTSKAGAGGPPRPDKLDAQEDADDEGASPSALSGLREAFGESKTAEKVTPEDQALNDLDRYGDVYDNPGGGDPDGIISTNDLEDIASGEFDEDAARDRLEQLGVSESEIDETLQRLRTSADTLLENDELREDIDVANDESDADGRISRGDLSKYVFERQQQDGFEPGPAASNRDALDDGVYTQDERDAELIQQQEQQILEAVNSGQPIQFTNANGQTEELTIRQEESSGGRTVYELTGADGHTIRIESELGASENRTALARIADYYTQTPEHLRESADKFELLREADDTAAASFNSDDDRIRFYEGLEHLNEEVFNHEFGHGIGYEKDGLGENIFHQFGQLFSGDDGEGAPEGWLGAIDKDNARINEYSETNHKEDFAENWAAYLEAVEQGPAALAQLRERFPARFAILEQIYNNA